MGKKKVGVILLNLGGPDSLEAVKPFLFNLFSDRDIIKLGPSFLQKPVARMISALRSKKTKENYRLIGDRSPIKDITEAQAGALERRLNRKANSYRVYVGMRYWNPFIGEALEKAVSESISELIAVPLFPHYSKATTGSCINELKKESSKHTNLSITPIYSWYNHPSYIRAVAETITQGLAEFSSEEKDETHILFSAHALPQSFIDGGDPYIGHIRKTIEATVSTVEIDKWHLSFQSRSGPVKWIGPSTEKTIERLAGEGVKNVLMVPISFVSDHVETLYEMDIFYKELAKKVGIRFVRAASLNTSPKFIETLAEIVEDTAKRFRE